MTHTRSEVGDSGGSLLGPSSIALRYQHVPHGYHTKPPQLLRRIKHHWGESTGHLGVEAYFYPRLYLVFTLDEQVEQLSGVDDCFAEVGHQADDHSVPLIGDLGERCGTGRHENLPDSIVELFDRELVDSEVRHSRPLLCSFVLKVPSPVGYGELLRHHADLGQDSHVEATHVEQQVGVVLAVHTYEGVIPRNGGDGPRQAVFYVPEDTSPEVDVVFHKPHPTVSRPALLVLVAHDVLVVGVGVLSQIPLDQLLGILG
mmetsp:Transcript_15168/g.27300  ORF Transcript_15168/g.27300 Transcript_15168/m.27300 type:complete len:258 (+) Transcript_15168:3164-3937(+)